MSLKPWIEIARPHRDVLQGTFQQSEFAADITQVATGTAPAEYQDAEMFFSRTYITEGMRLLLLSVVRRLAGNGGDPVIQLQTAFGGGKTHTMLTVLHLAKGEVSAEKLMGIPPILDEAGITSLPQARMAVLDGINMSPSSPRVRGDVSINTIWGEVAWQLLGEEGYQLVAKSDQDGTSPGKEILVELLTRAAPCVVLIDELVAFVRQLEYGQKYVAGTFDSNISFIQALTEAMKAVPNAVLLASLPESEAETGGVMGQQALNTLEKYFARVESVWKPVAAEEAFEIVRRRLFEDAGDRAMVEGIARQFCDFYRQNAAKFPTETQSNEYFERMCASYPIHPEIFDRLYVDWSTLDKFQRTRGVLQYMAIVIHRLWNDGNKDALIMPGSLPLSDGNVINKSIHYLPNGWEPVIEREVDGTNSTPANIDGQNTLFGSVQAARRTARTIFLGSAPSNPAQAVRGIATERILLGAVQPEQTVGAFEDVLRHLRDKLHYLYSEHDRFWLDTKANLRREMESRKQTVSDRDELLPLLKNRVNSAFGRNHSFAGIHIFTPSVDVPDDYGVGLRLVVLPVDAAYSRAEANAAYRAAEEILRNRGEQPRQRQNRLVFLAPDFDVISRLKDLGRTYLAWSSIVRDIESGALNQDVSHLNQAKKNREDAEKTLRQLVREAWKWLLAPYESFEKGAPVLGWESQMISPAALSLVEAIEQKLREEEWLITQWSPIHLNNLLKQWYFKNGTQEIGAAKVWQDSCHYLYMPRLQNDKVLWEAIGEGVRTQDFFAFASGKEGGEYLGFAFGRNAIASLDDYSLLISKEAAEAYADALKAAETVGRPTIEQTDTPPTADTGGGEVVVNGPVGGAYAPTSAPAAKTQFYGTVELEPISASIQFSDIMAEIIENFTSQYDVEVEISLDIRARKASGFDEKLQRVIKENSNMLKFSAAEFDEES